MRKVGLFIVIFICLISGCSCEKVKKTTIFSIPIQAYRSKTSETHVNVDPFGTYISLVGYYESDVVKVENTFDDYIREYHALLDRNYYYKDENNNFINNIRVINDSYGTGSSVIVDERIIEILKEGIKYTKLSSGKFNILAGALIDLWEERFIVFSDKYGVDPSQEEIDEALACVPSSSEIESILVLNESEKKVTFNDIEGCDRNSSISLGALAKSYFLDKLIKKDGYSDLRSAIFDAGQSSIIVKGNNPSRDNKKWYIAVNDGIKGKVLVQLQVGENRAVSTSSGEYKGYLKSDGIRRHHILDATSGYSGNYLVGCTAIGDSAMIMDIVTTTLMSMNLEEIKEYLKELEKSEIKVDVLLQISDNGTLKLMANEGMNKMISNYYEDVELEVINYGA